MMSNPFSLPPEEEIFWLRDVEQRKRAAEKAQQLDLKVHEKSTASSRISATKKVTDADLPMAPMPVDWAKKPKAKEDPADAMPDATFLTTIATSPAVGLLEPLRREEKDVRGYVRKKREMFLVQMALDVKRAEILRLDEKARMKEEALKKSQAMLDEDMTRFETFLQANAAKAQKAMKEAEAQAKKRQEKLQKIKQLKQQISGVHSEIAKFKELREECVRYKKFLDKLTPPEWTKQQAEIKANRKEARRQAWVNERVRQVEEKIEAEERKETQQFWEDYENELKKKRTRQKRKEEEEERKRKEDDLAARKKRLRKKYPDRKHIEKEYEDVYVDSEEEYELYFKKPKQLMDIFTELEEKNLFLIQNSQETEQALEELQQTFEKTQKDMGAKATQLRDSIAKLEANIEQEKKQCQRLRKSYDEKAGTGIQDAKLNDLAKKVEKVYLACGFPTDHDPDTLQMLGATESRLEELLTGIDEIYQQDSELIMRLERQKEKERRERVRMNRLEEQGNKQEERLNASLQRSQAPVFKKTGKQIMKRSPPLHKEKKVVKDTSEEEAAAWDHERFGLYIDKKTDMPRTELPEQDNVKPHRTILEKKKEEEQDDD